MDGQTCAVRDVLAGCIFDVPFEPVHVGDARVAPGIELKRELPVLAERCLLASDVPRLAVRLSVV
ncbi:MAG: hypothetical protein H0W08_11130 [Acidobacteria bacterium]|nr:hypothetical protein [Acidobacteriota bacterium]